MSKINFLYTHYIYYILNTKSTLNYLKALRAAKISI